MRLAAMQPYFLPYLGYWQLVASADVFVILDDVNAGGNPWLRRNRVLNTNNGTDWLTLHLSGLSQSRLVKDLTLDPAARWRQSLLRQCQRIPRSYTDHLPLRDCLEKVLEQDKSFLHVVNVLLMKTRDILGLSTEFVRSGDMDLGSDIRGQERILKICEYFGASEYLNPVGGRDLYSREGFQKHGIALRFLPVPPYLLPAARVHTSVFQDLACVGRDAYLQAVRGAQSKLID